MPEPMIFRTHGPSGVQHEFINRKWSEFAQTLDLTGYTRQQREALRDAFYAGAVSSITKPTTDSQS